MLSSLPANSPNQKGLIPIPMKCENPGILVVCDNVCESPALEKLHDNPEFIVHQVAVVHLHNVWVVVVTHYHNLVANKTGNNQSIAQCFFNFFIYFPKHFVCKNTDYKYVYNIYFSYIIHIFKEKQTNICQATTFYIFFSQTYSAISYYS